jgi:hypothetical protein
MWFPVVFVCRIALLTHLTAETRAPDVVQVKDAASGVLTARFAKTTMCTRHADNTSHALPDVLSHHACDDTLHTVTAPASVRFVALYGLLRLLVF